MGSFDILYTGSSSAARIPELGILQRAEEKYYDTIARKDEIATAQAKQNEQEYLAAMKNDPVYLVAGKNQQIQSDAIENYNNKWGKIFMQRNGRLTTQDKLDMQKDKMALTMMQQGLLSDQQRYLSEKEVMQKDLKGFYDPDVFNAEEQKYLKTGKYTPTALIPRPQDITLGFKNTYKDYNPTEQIRQWKDEAGTGWIAQDIQNMTREDAVAKLPEFILSNQGYIRRMLIDAEKPENSKEVEKYLMEYDENHNGVLDPAEKQNAISQPVNYNNPLLKWAANHYADDSIKIKPGTPKRTTGVKSGSWSVPAFGNYSVKTPPVMMREYITTVGGTTYKGNASYETSGRKMNVPLNGTMILRPSGNKDIGDTGQSSEPAIFAGVLERQDGSIGLHFITPTDDWNKTRSVKGTDLDVPAENMPGMWNFPIEYDGVQTTVGELMKKHNKGTQASKPKQTDIGL